MQSSPQILSIDGSQGEGGGQILRSSLSLAVLNQQSIHIENIRAKRKKPGLRPQHLTGATALARLSEAVLEGAEVGSSRLLFSPQQGCGGNHTIDIRTAGSTSLLLHALFYPMAYGKEGGTLTLCGGTHVDRAPTYHYLDYVWAPMLREFGLTVALELNQVGCYPKGGGEISASIEGNQTSQGIEWIERPPLTRLTVLSLFAEPSNRKRSKKHQITQRMEQAALQELDSLNLPPEVTIDTLPWTPHSLSVGAACHIFCELGPIRAGFTAFGERGQPAEQVGANAAKQAKQFLESPCCLEEHAADQVLLPLALASSPSVFTTPQLTGHLETNAAILQTFLPKLRIHFESQPHGVTVRIDPNASS